MADDQLYIVKINFDRKKYIAYGKNKNKLDVYERIDGDVAHHALTTIRYPSMFKFMPSTRFDLVTNPKKTTRAEIRKKYGRAFYEKMPPGVIIDKLEIREEL